MIAVLGGLGAAAAWATAAVCSSRSGRIIDPPSVLGWVMLVGLLVAGPAALIHGIPLGLKGPTIIWLALAGAGNVFGLLLMYAAMRIGQVALIAPIISAEGATAALIAVIFGEALSPPVGVTLAVIVLGILLASVARAEAEGRDGQAHARTVLLAIGASLAFGGSLYASGRAGTHLPGAWVAAAARFIGVPVLTVPLALSGRLRLTRRAAPLILTSGICEVLGFYAYTAGARHGIAVAAVLASQSGTFAALGGFLLFGERLSKIQLCGVATVIGGVAILSGLRP